MDALEFLKTQKRMCKKYYEPYSCGKCPLNEYEFSVCNKQPSEINESETLEIVEQWAKEHPHKTYKQDFLEKFPKAKLNPNNYPLFCRCDIYDCDCEDAPCKNTHRYVCTETCIECWNEEMEDK